MRVPSQEAQSPLKRRSQHVDEFASLTATEVVKMTTSAAVSGEKFINESTFSFQCHRSRWTVTTSIKPIPFFQIWQHCFVWLQTDPLYTRFLCLGPWSGCWNPTFRKTTPWLTIPVPQYTSFWRPGVLVGTLNSLRPSDTYMRQWSNQHWFR